MNCDRQLISAYYDDLLAPDVRDELQRHLATCDECQRTLTSYRGLGVALASIAAPPAPASLRVRFNRSLDHRVRPQFSLGLVGPFGALATAALVLVVVASFASRPSSAALAVVAAYPPNGATGVLLDDAIAVEFNSPIENEALGELQFRLEPSVPIETTILGSKVVLRPIVPLRPDTQYVVRIERGEKGSPSNRVLILPPPPTAAPLTVNFSTGRFVAAAASATAAARGSAPVSPTSAPAIALLPAPLATPIAQTLSAAAAPVATSVARPNTSTAALVSTHTPSPAACGAATSSRVAFVLRGRPELPARLGCAAEVERVVTYAEEMTEEGLLIAVDDERVRVRLLPDGRWVAADGAATPTPTPARAIAVIPSATTTPLAAAPVVPAASASAAPPTATPSPASDAAPTPATTPTAIAPAAPGASASLTPSPAPAITATADSPASSVEASPRPKDAAAGSSATPVPTVSPTANPSANLTATPTVNSVTTSPASLAATPTANPTTTSPASLAATPNSGRPPAATATAASAAPSRFAWVQVFEHGSVLLAPTADGSLGYVLMDDGSWSRLAARSPLPVATATATPNGARTPTLVTSPTPVSARNGRDREVTGTDGTDGAEKKGAGESPAPVTFIRATKRSA